MLYSGTLLTEVALYPVFVLALLGIASAIRRPTRRNQLLAVAGIALACSAKPLAIILAGVYVLAVVHLGVLDRRAGAPSARASGRTALRSAHSWAWALSRS